MSSTIERVETFIQRLDNMDYILNIEAHQIWYTKQSVFPSMSAERKTLSDYLANAISAYQENRDNEEKRLTYAETCLLWVNRAFTCGVIKEGKGLISKNKELDSKSKKLERGIKRLQERLDECNKKCQELEEENKKLHKLFGDDRFTGDVLSE